MHEDKHAWCMYVYIDIHIYGDRHECVCRYVHMYVCMQAGMHKSVHVSMCACSMYLCMELRIYIYVCRQTCTSLYLSIKVCM